MTRTGCPCSSEAQEAPRELALPGAVNEARRQDTSCGIARLAMAKYFGPFSAPTLLSPTASAAASADPVQACHTL